MWYSLRSSLLALSPHPANISLTKSTDSAPHGRFVEAVEMQSPSGLFQAKRNDRATRFPMGVKPDHALYPMETKVHVRFEWESGGLTGNTSRIDIVDAHIVTMRSYAIPSGQQSTNSRTLLSNKAKMDFEERKKHMR